MAKHSLLQFEITADLANIRLDRALAAHPQIATRSRAAKLIHDGLVECNNKPTKPSQITVEHQIVTVKLPIETDVGLTPYELKLNILHEDSHVIVIDKPAGLVVHPAAGHAQDTLVNALIAHTHDLSMGFGENRPGIVHRLDKDTSGILVVAKSDQAHHFLAKQFKQKSVLRRYAAVVFGQLKNREGRIETFLGRHPVDRKRFASYKVSTDGTPKGRQAITHYRVKANHPSGLSLVECRLETGRTHQIRVHLSELGHPIIGDRLYSHPSRVKSLQSVQLRKKISELSRLGLHAFELGFIHPEGHELRFFSDWPEDIKPLMKELGFEIHESQ